MSGTQRSVNTHCPYCALNCGLTLNTVEEGGAAATPVGMTRWKASPLTAGAVCSKGATAWQQLRHGDRVVRPLVRRNGRLVEAGWEEALDRAAAGFATIREAHGAEANALLSGGSLTNEKVYLVGKFARLALGTPHIDYNGRFCMVSAGSANKMAFGLDRAMIPLDELEYAELIIVVGANLSDAFPIMIPQTIQRARRRNAIVVNIDPRFGRWVQDDDVALQIRPGTDGILFLGVLRELIHRDLVDKTFIFERSTGFAEAGASADPWTPQRVAEATDVPAEAVIWLAEAMASARRCILLHGRGAEQQTMGTMNVLAMINAMMAAGHVGKRGSGINMLTGQRNGQGGREWGQRCNQLPAGRSITDRDHRHEVAAHWGVAVDNLPGEGATYVEILQKAGRGEIKGLLSIGNNMLVSSPDLAAVRNQMANLEHVVMIDPFLSEVADYADVVLPGTTFGEEEGTITTIEGRVVRCEQAVAPLAERSDIDIIRNLANRLGAGHQFSFVRGREVWAEMRRVSAGGPNDYSGITWDRARDGLFWPCPEEGHPGTPALYRERFAFADGKARFNAVTVTSPPRVVDDEYPFVLTTGRHLAHFLSRNQTKRIPEQQRKAPNTYVELHPDTAKGLGLNNDDRVVITSRQGRSTVAWKANEDLRPDTAFMLYHWPECNELVAADLDPISKIPGFKYTPVHLMAAPKTQDAVIAESPGATEPLAANPSAERREVMI